MIPSWALAVDPFLGLLLRFSGAFTFRKRLDRGQVLPGLKDSELMPSPAHYNTGELLTVRSMQ